MPKPTLHVVSLPHTTLTERDISCAYSMKVLKFVPMMQAQGYPVILYGPDEIDCTPDEHVVITTVEDRKRWGFRTDRGFDTVQAPLRWDSNEPYWFESNARAVEQIRNRADEFDLICLIAGNSQQPIAEHLGDFMSVEWGVGYEGIFANYCAFESYAWMHYVYGKNAMTGRAFDAVIPNFFDLKDFKHPDTWQGAPKADYLLYVGRVIHRKGVTVAAEIAKRMGRPLVIAGPGVLQAKPGKLLAEGVKVVGDHVEYVGEVGFEERANLMGRAAAVLVPTLYCEPFGGVAVEAMLSGTPVVASDWGSFTEIVTPDVGARFHTPREGVKAVEYALTLDPQEIRAAVESRYSLEAVGPQFTRWFESLGTLWDAGWNT